MAEIEPEFEVLNACVTGLEKLDEPTRARVLRYLNQRYDFRPPSSGPLVRSSQ